jgi:hypothetical protein
MRYLSGIDGLPWKMVDPLMRQHGLESVRLRVRPRPRQVVVRVGRVYLVEPVGVTDLKKVHSVSWIRIKDP